MSHVELSYTLDGEQKETVSAEDGVLARLETPAGVALAKVRPQGKKWIDKTPLVNRVGTKFPTDSNYMSNITAGDGLNYKPDSLLDFLNKDRRKLRKADSVTTGVEIATQHGMVAIKVTASNHET